LSCRHWNDDARRAELTITVVPDSGTDDLVGLTGLLTIRIDEGKHSYDFEYALPAVHWSGLVVDVVGARLCVAG
jgi:hypothetical protein